ncbi:MAG: squalene--hopene cyclase [Chloroflexi bacterium]|nr:squalene--hopene cyclase [Chloroflexota bacterium]
MNLSRMLEDQDSTIATAASIKKAVKVARACLLGMQRPTGYWCGELEGDSILESEYILLMYSLGRHRDPLTQKVAAYLRKRQTPRGGWCPYPGAPDDVSASIKAYFALKLSGDSPDDPHMRMARDVILRLGGVPAANSFTKIYLALFGQFHWNDVPAIPPEIILLPPWLYFNIYAMSSWSRTILVPLSIVWAHRPHFSTPGGLGIDELFPGGRANADCSLQTHAPFPSWRHFFLMVDRGLKVLNALPVKPWRARALAAAESWVIDHFNGSDGLGAIFPPIVNSVWALLCRGYALDSPEVESQLRELYQLVIEESGDARVQPCTSPVWDTALACIALDETSVIEGVNDGGGSLFAEPAINAATDWLVEREVKSPGDWKVTRPNLEPGGWYFEFANEFYPDIDDTAMVLIALQRAGRGSEEVSQRAIRWVLGMQCRSGGWASFDVDNDRGLLCEFPFADHNAMIDPPTADITGRVLEMLGAQGYNERSEAVRRAVLFLRREQEADGSWFGRWGVNYIYGTWQVIKGLIAVGVDPGDTAIRRGVRWLTDAQNADGGWGETCDSYEKDGVRRHGPSMPSQTAWALMALIAAGEHRRTAVHRGIEYLLRTQQPDGNWAESNYTGTGFPRVFYLKYHLYRLYFPLFALGMFARASRADAVSGIHRNGISPLAGDRSTA